MIEGSPIKFNPAVNIVIENDVERTPTMLAEEAAARIMERLVYAAPTAPAEFRGQFCTFKDRIHQMIFDEALIAVNKATNRERRRVLKG